jgi:hypothetical protein
MNDADYCAARAAEARGVAKMAMTEEERVIWRVIADRWERLTRGDIVTAFGHPAKEKAR